MKLPEVNGISDAVSGSIYEMGTGMNYSAGPVLGLGSNMDGMIDMKCLSLGAR